MEQYLLVLAEFVKIQGGIRAPVHVHNSFAHALAEIGTENRSKDILPGTVTGEHSAAFALTEPDHGNGRDLGTQARWDGGAYVISGWKSLITNSNIASHFIALARTSPTGLLAILVKRDGPGLTIEPLPQTMGCKGGQHGLLAFNVVRIPVASVIGREGEGEEHLERALEISRVFITARSPGTAQRSLDLASEHARTRVTFGKPLAESQAVQRYLAEMAMDAYALRHMLPDAGRRWDAGQRIPLEASLRKLSGLEAGGGVTDRASLVQGGIGYTQRIIVERLYRDARLKWLEEGLPAVHDLVAARKLTRAMHGNTRSAALYPGALNVNGKT